MLVIQIRYRDGDIIIEILPNEGGAKGAGVLLEKELGCKCPGFGCQLHAIERYEDAAMRTVFGPTSSPEEGFAKKYKEWANSTTKSTDDVIEYTITANFQNLLHTSESNIA